MAEETKISESKQESESKVASLFKFVADQQNDIGVKKILNIVADIVDGKYDKSYEAFQKAHRANIAAQKK